MTRVSYRSQIRGGHLSLHHVRFDFQLIPYPLVVELVGRSSRCGFALLFVVQSPAPTSRGLPFVGAYGVRGMYPQSFVDLLCELARLRGARVGLRAVGLGRWVRSGLCCRRLRLDLVLSRCVLRFLVASLFPDRRRLLSLLRCQPRTGPVFARAFRGIVSFLRVRFSFRPV